MRKYIVIPDSFKGTLSSIEVCRIAEKKILEQDPGCRVAAIPVADGGEGTVDCFLAAGKWKRVGVKVRGPYGEPSQACYAKLNEKAVIELAQAAGLPQVEGRENPALTTTYGVGMMIRDALRQGCREIVIGLGGSCTNDGGCGLAGALGAKFYDADGRAFLPVGGSLDRIARIDISEMDQRLKECRITAMCDIDNPMYGPGGAACVFAPQKGAGSGMVQMLDRNLRCLARRFREDLRKTVDELPGAGAAGAAGAGIAAFLGGELKPGIQMVLDLVEFDRELEDADLVITGEGRLDSQSVRGKVIAGVAGRAAARHVPVAAVVGSIGEGAEKIYEAGVTAIFSINRQPVDFSVSRGQSAENLAAAVENLIRFRLAFAGEYEKKDA